jgi:hypothetical protein
MPAVSLHYRRRNSQLPCSFLVAVWRFLIGGCPCQPLGGACQLCGNAQGRFLEVYALLCSFHASFLIAALQLAQATARQLLCT